MIPHPTRPVVEVADILRAHGEAYGAHHAVSPLQAAVLRRLVACRTAALGGHRDACDRCGYARVSYNSCRDRHCPKCQGVKRAQWLEKRLERLLPVEHFHVVFTLPAALHPLALYHPRRLYDRPKEEREEPRQHFPVRDSVWVPLAFSQKAAAPWPNR